jgi:hypothetical protein
VENALCNGPVQFGLCQLKGRSGRLSVAAGNRHFNLLDESAYPAHPRAIDRSTIRGLTDTFFGGFVAGHTSLTIRVQAYRDGVQIRQQAGAGARDQGDHLPPLGGAGGAVSEGVGTDVPPIPGPVFGRLARRVLRLVTALGALLP